MRKRVIIVGININNKNNFEESIIELKNLCIACDMEVVGKVEQNLKKINPTFYMGSGKIDELKNLVEENNADIVIFNNELSASQVKNIEEEIFAEARGIPFKTNQIETSKEAFPPLTAIAELLSKAL